MNTLFQGYLLNISQPCTKCLNRVESSRDRGETHSWGDDQYHHDNPPPFKRKRKEKVEKVGPSHLCKWDGLLVSLHWHSKRPPGVHAIASYFDAFVSRLSFICVSSHLTTRSLLNLSLSLSLFPLGDTLGSCVCVCVFLLPQFGIWIRRVLYEWLHLILFYVRGVWSQGDELERERERDKSGRGCCLYAIKRDTFTSLCIYFSFLF
jgi:hypothetical protein